MSAPPTPARITRLALWAQLWLAWLVQALPLIGGVLEADAAVRALVQRRLSVIEQAILGVVAWRAIHAHGSFKMRPLAMRLHDRRNGARLQRRGRRIARILYGPIRRDVRRPALGLAARIAALRAVHTRIDALAARLLKRLKRGFLPLVTPVMTRPPSSLPIERAPPPPPRFADSS
ncbi:MAG: hypothetical protein GC206_03690 [Alphaproteobacteria bacterium]|nr:hypothetical protein [Alphaproteobacteria bacterium]